MTWEMQIHEHGDRDEHDDNNEYDGNYENHETDYNYDIDQKIEQTKMAESSQQQYVKSRLSRMRNVRANAAGMLRRAPSFLPESTTTSCNNGVVGSCTATGLSRVGSSKLKRSNSSSSTFYVQLPSTERKHSSGSVNRPFISTRRQQRQFEPEYDSETSGCESGSRRLTHHIKTGFSIYFIKREQKCILFFFFF